MDGGEDVLFDHSLAHQDGILEVVSTPTHKGNSDVPAEGEFSHFSGGTIGNDLPIAHPLSRTNDRLLVETGVLVGALELGDLIDIHCGGERLVFAITLGGPDHNTRGIYIFHHTIAPGNDCNP